MRVWVIREKVWPLCVCTIRCIAVVSFEGECVVDVVRRGGECPTKESKLTLTVAVLESSRLQSDLEDGDGIESATARRSAVPTLQSILVWYTRRQREDEDGREYC